jgi:hypothetical protein
LTGRTNNLLQKRNPSEDKKRRRTGALLLDLDDDIGDLIVVAILREQVRTLGLDRVRTL